MYLFSFVGVRRSNGEPMALFRCDICEQVFTGLKYINQHTNTHFDKSILFYQCKLCSACFKFRTQLINHAWRKHKIPHIQDKTSEVTGMNVKEDLDSNSQSVMSVVSDENQNEVKSVDESENNNNNSDATTDEAFNNNNYSPEEGEIQSSRQPNVNPAAVTKIKTRHGIYFKVNGAFMCRWCNRSFFRLFCLQRHERVHTGFKPCYCKECGKGFSESRNLRQHIMRFHANGTQLHLLRNVRRRKLESFSYSGLREKENTDSHESHSDDVPVSMVLPKLEDGENPVTQLEDEIRERENLGADVMVVFPSDEPLQEENRSVIVHKNSTNQSLKKYDKNISAT